MNSKKHEESRTPGDVGRFWQESKLSNINFIQPKLSPVMCDITREPRTHALSQRWTPYSHNTANVEPTKVHPFFVRSEASQSNSEAQGVAAGLGVGPYKTY